MVATTDLCGLQAGPSGAVPSQLPLLASGTELDLPLSWAGKLWVACSLVISSILASGCLDQFNFRHVTPIVCFGFISAPVFPLLLQVFILSLLSLERAFLSFWSINETLLLIRMMVEFHAYSLSSGDNCQAGSHSL